MLNSAKSLTPRQGYWWEEWNSGTGKGIHDAPKSDLMGLRILTLHVPPNLSCGLKELVLFCIKA